MSHPILYETVRVPDRNLDSVEEHIFKHWPPGGNNLFAVHQIADRTNTSIRHVRRVVKRLLKDEYIMVFWSP